LNTNPVGMDLKESNGKQVKSLHCPRNGDERMVKLYASSPEPAWYLLTRSCGGQLCSTW